MSAPTLPGAQPGPSTHHSAPASQRAREIQDALKSIVLQTASTLRARTQLARLPSSIPRSSATAAASLNAASSSLDKLTGECTRYLSLVHGLRDYLLHAQAALEIELEAATQREAEEAKKAAEAAAEALEKQQEADERAKKEAEEEAQRKLIADEAKAKDPGSSELRQEQASGQNAEDVSTSVPTTPPLPFASTGAVQPGDGRDGKNDKAGKAAGDAIVIDSDGDDEDDVPLAFAPKPGSADDASKTIDLTDSPALANAAKPVVPVSQPPPPDAVPASGATEPTADATTTSAAAHSIPGLDLSAFGIDMSTLGNLPDLSSLNIPGLANTTSTAADTSSLAPATDFSELEKMMGMDFSSTASTNDQSSSAMPDLSSLGNFNMGSGAGGFGEDADMFGTGNGGLDLSNFDFSGLAGGADAGMGGGGGVDLSSFLTNFAPGAEGGSAGDGGAGS